MNATAAFTTSTDELFITLTNLQADPTSVVQNLSGLAFTLSNTSLLSGTLSSSAGSLRTIASNGTYADGAASATGWAFSSTGGGGFLLNVLGTATAPAHTIVGPPNGSGFYASANNSIAGNAPHNPFIGEFATFTLSIPGVTDATTIAAATFSFGTSEGNDVPGVPPNEIPQTEAPEPASLLLIGGGLVLLGSIRRLRTRS